MYSIFSPHVEFKFLFVCRLTGLTDRHQDAILLYSQVGLRFQSQQRLGERSFVAANRGVTNTSLSSAAHRRVKIYAFREDFTYSYHVLTGTLNPAHSQSLNLLLSISTDSISLLFTSRCAVAMCLVASVFCVCPVRAFLT